MIAATLTAPALAPLEFALAEMRRRQGVDATRGLVSGVILPDPGPGWTTASPLVSGQALGGLLAAADERWGGSPHAGAALAWKCYTYWLALPAVLGWATARRVPLLDPEDVLVNVSGQRPFLTLGLRRARVAVLPTDPLAVAGGAHITVVGSQEALLSTLRDTLRDRHLDPLSAEIRSWVRLGERTLLGSLASGVAYGVLRGAPRDATDLRQIAHTLLSALDIADLVDLEPTSDGYAVHRRTCCLAFTLPQPKVCSGCCIRPS